MPIIPETWLAEFTANLTQSGIQSDPEIVQLATGNILVVWRSTATGGAGSPAGDDVVGQIFSPIGEPVGSEFRLNVLGTVNNERLPDIAATPDGGFIVVYERSTIASNIESILIDEYNAAGVRTNGAFIASDASVDLPNVADPRIAISSATSALIVYRELEAGGDSRIVAKVYNPTTNTVGPLISILNSAGSNSEPEVDVLTNGNYVITMQSGLGADASIFIRVLNPAGGNVVGATEIASTNDTETDIDPSVAALTGGGFVVAWQNVDAVDSDILVQRFNPNGSLNGSVITVSSGGSNDANEPHVVAMADGGFIVFWDDDTLDALQGRRYSATGTALTAAFTVASGSGSISQPAAELLADGRVALTFVGATGEISMTILDTRDAASAGEVLGNNDYQVGTIGNDTFTANLTSEFVFGHDGDDIITETGQVREYYGGAGNDRLNVSSPINSDVHDGGDGIDTIDWSGSGIGGAVFDLQVATATLGASTEVMTGFENLIGTGGNDRIGGTAAQNRLNGGAGDDTVNGRAGDDILSGVGGNDSLFGELGEDSLFGNLGNDFLTGGGGNDRLDGGGGNDTLIAGAGNDILLGNVGNDTLNGADGNDSLNGGGGSDTLLGSTGDDILNGNIGFDSLNGGTGNDSLAGEMGNDTMTGGAGVDSFIYTAGVDRITDFVDNVDTVVLDDALWGGIVLTIPQILDFASVVAGDTVFEFAPGNRLVIEGLANKALLADDLVII